MKSKYHSKKTYADGHIFDSLKESKHYWYLKQQEKNGEICDLNLQPEFELQPSFEKNGKRIRAIKYKADFSYYNLRDEKKYIVDCKGYKTDVYKIKKKLFEYRYPEYEITEV